MISEKGGSFLEKGGAADFRKRGLLKITFYTFIFKEELYRQNMYTMLLKIGVDFLKIWVDCGCSAVIRHADSAAEKNGVPLSGLALEERI